MLAQDTAAIYSCLDASTLTVIENLHKVCHHLAGEVFVKVEIHNWFFLLKDCDVELCGTLDNFLDEFTRDMFALEHARRKGHIADLTIETMLEGDRVGIHVGYRTVKAIDSIDLTFELPKS